MRTRRLAVLWIAALAMAGTLLLVGPGAQPTTAAETDFNVSGTGSGGCASGCCPQLTATINVDPATGLWTVNITNGTNPVPINVTGATSQTTTTVSHVGGGSSVTAPGSTAPASNLNTGGQAGGNVSGTSENVAQGDKQDTSDNSGTPGGIDIDSQTKIEVTFTTPCPGTIGCTSGTCTYVVKFTCTSDEGFSVTQTL
jgi:hypothetical protein